MTLEDFLEKAHDRNINRERLIRAFKEFMYHNHAYDNLNSANRDFVLDIILKHRDKLMSGEHSSSIDIDHEYYNIFEHRQSLGLLDNDLKNVKEILNSFKNN